MKNNTIPYIIIYSGEFKVFRAKLTDREILRVLDKLTDISVLGNSDIEFKNEYQQLYFDKLLTHYEKNIRAYKAKVENGKKGGRPKSTLQTHLPETVNTPTDNGLPPAVYDITCNPNIEKVFELYRSNCPSLKPLKYERRNRETLELVAKFLEETNNDFDYFKMVCQNADKQKVICDNALDFKGVVKNHIALYNEKFKKGNAEIGTKLTFND